MTTITYKENGKRIALCVEGHSGYASSGADIVCSALSILTYCFCERLTELEDEGSIEISVFETDTDGCIDVEYEDAYGETYSIIKMLKIGFYALQEEYPNNVRIVWGENDY